MCSLLDIIDRGGYMTIQKVFLAEFWKFFQEHILWGFFFGRGEEVWSGWKSEVDLWPPNLVNVIDLHIVYNI